MSERDRVIDGRLDVITAFYGVRLFSRGYVSSGLLFWQCKKCESMNTSISKECHRCYQPRKNSTGV